MEGLLHELARTVLLTSFRAPCTRPMIEKTFPSAPNSLQAGLREPVRAEPSDPLGSEPDGDLLVLSVIVDSFQE